MIVIIVALLTLAWLLPFLLLWKIPYPQHQGQPAENQSWPAVSVVIPARNEERSLPTLLESLQRQDLRPDEIIVVNDHSNDATAEIAARGGATVIESEPLPRGWLGKPWACWQGAQQARGQLLVFLDADTFLETEGLRKIVSSYLVHGGLLSVWPYHRMKHIYERLSALFNIIIMASMRSFTLQGRNSLNLGAFGPCVVCQRSDYFTAGGHQGVRGAILEDVALGQEFQRAGFGIHNYGGRGAVSFRMYPAGIGSLVTGFTKSMASGAQAASPKILIPIFLWVAGGFIVSFLLPFTLIGSNLQASLPWLILQLLYTLQIFWILSRMGNYGLVSALLYPLLFLFFAAVFVYSLLRTFFLREVRWKGRKIDIER
jgi:4,4'-diaponeurosporenoate glycosyltransferase